MSSRDKENWTVDLSDTWEVIRSCTMITLLLKVCITGFGTFPNSRERTTLSLSFIPIELYSCRASTCVHAECNCVLVSDRPIDLTKSYPSSLADNGQVSWSTRTVETNGQLKISFPQVRSVRRIVLYLSITRLLQMGQTSKYRRMGKLTTSFCSANFHYCTSA
jgi:hypothetical protein